MNRIAMAMRSAILALRRQGWSFRRIARELGVHRDTVSRCVRVAREGPKAANPTALPAATDAAQAGGSDRATEAQFGVRAEWTAGSGAPEHTVLKAVAKGAQTGLDKAKSEAEALRKKAAEVDSLIAANGSRLAPIEAQSGHSRLPSPT